MSLYFLPHWRCNLTSLTDLKGTCSSSLSSPHISFDIHLRHEPILNDVRKATGDKKLSFSKRGRHSLHKLSTLKASPYIGLGSKIWLVVGLQGWRRFQKFTPCLTEPLPDGSKMDLEPAKPEPMTKAGGTSLPTCLRRGKNCSSPERGVRVNERNTPADPPHSEGGGGGSPEEWRSEAELGKGGRGKGGFQFYLCFSLSYSIFDNTLFPPNEACFACDSNWCTISQSLSWPMSFFILFSSHVLLRRVRASWWAPGSQLRSTHHTSFLHCL